jgi:hypothetical protein
MITQFLKPIDEGLEPLNISKDYLGGFASVPLHGSVPNRPGQASFA